MLVMRHSQKGVEHDANTPFSEVVGCVVQTMVGVVSSVAALQVDSPWQMQVVTDILEPLPLIAGFHVYIRFPDLEIHSASEDLRQSFDTTWQKPDKSDLNKF